MRKNYYLLAIFIFTWLLICKLECSKADVQNSEINGRFRPQAVIRIWVTQYKVNKALPSNLSEKLLRMGDDILNRIMIIY